MVSRVRPDVHCYSLGMTRRVSFFHSPFTIYHLPLVGLTRKGAALTLNFLLLGGRPMVGHQTLNLAIGVRVPASQPTTFLIRGLLDPTLRKFAMAG